MVFGVGHNTLNLWTSVAVGSVSGTLQCIIVFEVFSNLGSCDQGWNKGWTSRVAARGANFRGAKTSMEYSHSTLNDDVI